MKNLVIHLIHINREIANCIFENKAYTNIAISIAQHAIENLEHIDTLELEDDSWDFQDALENCKDNTQKTKKIKLVIEYLDKQSTSKEAQSLVNAIKLFNSIDAGINKSNIEGNIAIDHDSIEQHNNQSSGDIWIDIDNLTIKFNCWDTKEHNKANTNKMVELNNGYPLEELNEVDWNEFLLADDFMVAINWVNEEIEKGASCFIGINCDKKQYFIITSLNQSVIN